MLSHPCLDDRPWTLPQAANRRLACMKIEDNTGNRIFLDSLTSCMAGWNLVPSHVRCIPPEPSLVCKTVWECGGKPLAPQGCRRSVEEGFMGHVQRV